MSPLDNLPADNGMGPVPVMPTTAHMTTLHLGVLVQPYRARTPKARPVTTGDVAEFLESKYHLMASFAHVHRQDILDAVEYSVAGGMESMLMGRQVDLWGSATQEIQQMFRDFINSKESENIGIPGTPTAAAIAGVSHRRKHPYAKRNPRRPSFRDTGLFVGSFRAWAD